MASTSYWEGYPSTPALRFDFSCSPGLVPELPLEEVDFEKYDGGIFAYPEYKGMLTSNQYMGCNYVYMALRHPRPGEIPTHRRVSDGTPWVERNLGWEGLWWDRHGRDSIPIEGTESALLNLTTLGEPGSLQMYCRDYHPEYPSQTIAIALVDPNTGQRVSERVIELCTANVSRPTNTPLFPYIDPESMKVRNSTVDAFTAKPLHFTYDDDWGTPWVPPSNDGETCAPAPNIYWGETMYETEERLARKRTLAALNVSK